MSRDNEKFLGALLDSVRDLVVLINPDGTIGMFNRACKELTGYSHEEALGRNLLGLLGPEGLCATAQRGFPDPAADAARQPHDVSWKTKSGQERLIRWRCTALTLPGEPGPHVLCIGTDVTEQRENERKFRAQSRLMEIFFESTVSCAVLLDRDFNFIRVNKAYARACQRDVSEFAGRNHFDMYPSDARRLFDEVVRSKRPHSVEARAFEFPDHPEWGITYWDWNLVPVLNDEGEIEVLIFCLNDVTERERTEQRLLEAMNRMLALSRQAAEAQELERRRIGLDLHDEIGQGLTALKLILESCLDCEKANGNGPIRVAFQTVNRLIESSRRIAFDLRPPALDDLGLLAALLGLIDRHSAHTGLEISFRHVGLDKRLPAEIETAAYRIVQESLTNTSRHAGVRQAVVLVRATGKAVVLKVEDHGAGFDRDSVLASGNGNGLFGMQERARQLGGRLTVESATGAGTVITADFPLDGAIRQTSGNAR